MSSSEKDSMDINFSRNLPISLSSVVKTGTFALIAVIATISGGCTTDRTDAHKVSHPLQMSVRFYDEAGNLVPSDAQPSDLALELGAIAGSIGGAPGHTLERAPIGRGTSVRVDLDGLAGKVEKQTSQLNQSLASSLRISPSATRFARVAKWVDFRTPTAVTLKVGFVDAATGKGLTLLYFDRPCRLTGTLSSRTSSTGQPPGEVAVEVESAGWVWMTGTQNGQSSVVYSRAEAPHPRLVIAPPDSKVWPTRGRAISHDESR